MPGLQIFLDAGNYPEVDKLVSGQSVVLTVAGTAQKARNGAYIKIDSISLGKKQKLSTQEILLRQANDRLKNIEHGVSNQNVAL